MIWGIIITLAIIAVKVWYDYYHPVHHTKEWWYMAIASTPAIYFFTQASALSWYFAAPLSALMIAWFIWLMFDGFYNLVRSFNWWFTGSNDPDDAKTDNFLQGLKLWQHVVIKIGGNAVLITTYILTK